MIGLGVEHSDCIMLFDGAGVGEVRNYMEDMALLLLFVYKQAKLFHFCKLDVNDVISVIYGYCAGVKM